MIKVRLAYDIESDSIVDGPGIRTVLWFQGCPHRCFGCHNPETHDFTSGKLFSITEVLNTLGDLKFQDGITFTGGEPLQQPKAVLAIAEKYHDKNLWLYTGYDFQEILFMSEENDEIKQLLKYLDVIVDGKFDLRKKSLNESFKGSSNQRVIDVPASLQKNRAVEKSQENIMIDDNAHRTVYL